MNKEQGYHLEPSVGLLNDPNGLVFYKGIYHVFFQWNRFEKNHSYKEWGHFTSKDLVKWKREGSALLPDQPYERNGVYSGSACVKNGRLYLYYTGNDKSGGIRKSSQCLAVTEDGKTFIKKGIILATPSAFTEHFRDPKVWKTENGYYMVIGAQKKDGQGAVALCSSQDGENWNYDRILAETKQYEMIECPDFFKIDGQKILVYCLQHRDNEKDTSQESFTVYKNILFDEEKNQEVQDLDEGCRRLDQGFDFYAPQTFEIPDGRRILFAWMSRMNDEEEKKFSQGEKSIQCMTLPREISYKNGELCQMPIKELEERLCEYEHSQKCFAPEGMTLEKRTYCVKLEKNSGSFMVSFQDGEVVINYEQEEGLLKVRRKSWVSEGQEERICEIGQLENMEVWSDVSSTEIFVNGGSRVFSMRNFPESEYGKIKITGELNEASVKVYDIPVEKEEQYEQ